MDDQLFQLIVARLDKIESKVEELLQFRWSIYGVTVVISTILGISFQLILNYMNK